MQDGSTPDDAASFQLLIFVDCSYNKMISKGLTRISHFLPAGSITGFSDVSKFCVFPIFNNE